MVGASTTISAGSASDSLSREALPNPLSGFAQLLAQDQIERFRDGAIGPAERRAAMLRGNAMAEQIARTNALLRHCRVGRMVDRRSTAEKIAQVMLRETRRKGCCTQRDLQDAGFSAAEIERHASAARAIARGLYERVDG